MGGSANGIGNVTPVAEANIWQDADAARIVFQSGMPLTMVGYDATCLLGFFTQEDMARIRLYGELATFGMDIQRVSLEQGIQKGKGGFALADPLAMAVAIDPTVARLKSYHVTIETSPGLTEGQTIVDRRGLPGINPNVQVVVDANREKFITVLETTLKG
jgi:inosine-uridine nucleoside N-ribohydrolase